MAFVAKLLITSAKIESKSFHHEQETNTYYKRLSAENREDWTENELEQAIELSRSSNGTVILFYIECFGGACDHWAVVYNRGNKINDFKEVDNMTPIMQCVGITLPENGYFAPLDLSVNPSIERI